MTGRGKGSDGSADAGADTKRCVESAAASLPASAPAEAERQVRVDRAAERLRPLEREVLRQSAAEGLDTWEIAARLGLRHRKVEKLLARAIYKLDRALEQPDPPWWSFW